MIPNEKLFKVFDEQTKFLRAIGEQVKLVERFRESITANIPKIELPKIVFPKFEFPLIEIDTGKIEKLAKNNSKYGWTLTGEIDTNMYLDEDLLEKDQEFIDSAFKAYFEYNSNKNLMLTVDTIMSTIDDKWKNVLEDCIHLYETEKFRVIIPMLITIVEGEISKIANSDNIGKRLLNEWKEQSDENHKGFMVLVSYTLQEYLISNIFVRKDFTDERGTVINRNWILHGRDDPSLWTRVDALKLINMISTLQFIKNHK
ncbi:hypothetical protein [Alkalihalobacillus trypoxylicola]|uniref:Uncharacterized protein n=1 Tax=Alkalihalobacillus trypoxylicola TaxID=519424 RepID=A0A161Q1S9_9BACI|nr:hypothetical protein [Alkalihalobacillus trypoxylicola]KYG34921.1 hypothetical protein AZF04_00895 [Alkalihalobacillus trypoxylicola]